MRLRATSAGAGTRSSHRGWVPAVVIGAALYCVAAVAISSARAQVRADPVSRASRGNVLTAVQLLEYRPTGADARVRFEWERVSGAREYRLVGHWTGVSWAVRTREYVVTSRNATSWTSRHVTFEVPLPAGHHSWRLIAVFSPNDVRVLGDSTPASFAVK